MRTYPPGHTTASGQGHQHQQARTRALRNLIRDGQALCARCEAQGREHVITSEMVEKRPDGRLVSAWLDLDDFPGRRFGGPQQKRLSFRACNRGDGAKVANAVRAARKRAEYSRW